MGKRPIFASGFCQEEWLLNKRTCLVLGGLIFVLLVGLSLLLVALLVPGVKDSSALTAIGSATTTLSGSGILMTVFSVAKKDDGQPEVQQPPGLHERSEEGNRDADQLRVLHGDLPEAAATHRPGNHQPGHVLPGAGGRGAERHKHFALRHARPLHFHPGGGSQHHCLVPGANQLHERDGRQRVPLPEPHPEMGTKSKLQQLQDAVQSREDLMYKIITRNVERGVRSVKGKTIQLVEMESPGELDQSQIDAQAVRYIHEAFYSLHDAADCLHKYIPDSIIQMRRIVNTVPITIRLLLQQNVMRHTMSARAVAAWVVLANQWPCRLSWVLQCLEDRQQMRPWEEEFRNRLLWGIFVENCRELYSMHKDLQNILALDGDSELFQMFLAKDFPFTVHEANVFLKATINLDHSIRHKLGLVRGLNSLNKAYETGGAASPTRSVPVCKGVQCSRVEECS
uniref:NTPase KAP family P-loop domain containing 1 n=1 Tax=Pelodiscus sinensis TaxID=13735 RepID=K7EXG5_PELSI